MRCHNPAIVVCVGIPVSNYTVTYDDVAANCFTSQLLGNGSTTSQVFRDVICVKCAISVISEVYARNVGMLRNFVYLPKKLSQCFGSPRVCKISLICDLRELFIHQQVVLRILSDCSCISTYNTTLTKPVKVKS